MLITIIGSALRAQPDVSKRLRGYIEMFKSFHSDLRRGSALAHKGSVSVPQDDLQTLSEQPLRDIGTDGS